MRVVMMRVEAILNSWIEEYSLRAVCLARDMAIPALADGIA